MRTNPKDGRGRGGFGWWVGSDCFWVGGLSLLLVFLFVLILKAEIEHNIRRNDLFETFREDLVKNFLRLNGEKNNIRTK